MRPSPKHNLMRWLGLFALLGLALEQSRLVPWPEMFICGSAFDYELELNARAAGAMTAGVLFGVCNCLPKRYLGVAAGIAFTVGGLIVMNYPLAWPTALIWAAAVLPLRRDWLPPDLVWSSSLAACGILQFVSYVRYYEFPSLESPALVAVQLVAVASYAYGLLWVARGKRNCVLGVFGGWLGFGALLWLLHPDGCAFLYVHAPTMLLALFLFLYSRPRLRAPFGLACLGLLQFWMIPMPLPDHVVCGNARETYLTGYGMVAALMAAGALFRLHRGRESLFCAICLLSLPAASIFGITALWPVALIWLLARRDSLSPPHSEEQRQAAAIARAGALQCVCYFHYADFDLNLEFRQILYVVAGLLFVFYGCSLYFAWQRTLGHLWAFWRGCALGMGIIWLMSPATVNLWLLSCIHVPTILLFVLLLWGGRSRRRTVHPLGY